MKRLMNLYNDCKAPIRIIYVGMVLLAFGFLIQNENVNIFYTFRNSFLLQVANISYYVGQLIIINIPLIFVVGLIGKKTNSAFPCLLAVVGYFTYMTILTLFSPQNLTTYAYNTNSLITSIISNKYPLETGLFGSLLIAYSVRLAFIYSRHRGSFSLLGFLNRDTAAVIYTILLTMISGLLASYLFPILISYLQTLIQYIGKNLSDPIRLALYGGFDRLLSIFGLGKMIRYPFWFTSLGGSYVTIAGQTVLGDVNIWDYITEISSTYYGCGRFITPYYIINMFAVPAVYCGILTSVSDSKEKKRLILPIVFGCILSFVAGNPLPLELTLLLTSPLLLILYLIIVGILFAVLPQLNIYLGFSAISNDVVSALPGVFPDYIINLRNVKLFDSVINIALIGLAVFAVLFIITFLYYRFFAYDALNLGRLDNIERLIYKAVGGVENINDVGSGYLRVNLTLNDLESVSPDELVKIGTNKITETKDGISIEFGSSSWIIANRIKKNILKIQNESPQI